MRPVRKSYLHVSLQPKYPLRDLTNEEHERYSCAGYVAFERYPEDEAKVGRYWTKAQLDTQGCGTATTMALALAETYARNPLFYGMTYCAYCQMHKPVAEFIWLDGSVVGS